MMGVSGPPRYPGSKLFPASPAVSSSTSSLPFSLSASRKKERRAAHLCAARQQRQQAAAVEKRAGGRRRKPAKPAFDEVEDEAEGDDEQKSRQGYPSPLPKPPAGFVLDPHGRVLMASSKRIATIVDSTNNLPLECVIRRVFQSSRGDECMLLCPVDTPIQILRSTNFNGWSAVSDEEVEAIIPAAAYSLAKIHMHLVVSGFCYTARGGFCYSEEDIFEFGADDGEEIDGLPSEGVEITCFHLDENGQLQIADDDLLDDPAIMSAIDEETEFNALVEEEAALLESLLGER